LGVVKLRNAVSKLENAESKLPNANCKLRNDHLKLPDDHLKLPNDQRKPRASPWEPTVLERNWASGHRLRWANHAGTSRHSMPMVPLSSMGMGIQGDTDFFLKIRAAFPGIP